MPPLGRVVDEPGRRQRPPKEIPVGARPGADRVGARETRAAGLLRVRVDPGSHVELSAVVGCESEIDRRARTVRGNVRRRDVPAGRAEQLLLGRAGIACAQLAQVLLEIRALERWQAVALDEENPE